jgi:hypothetical protein
VSVTGSLIESCVSYGLRITGANTVRTFISGNTFFGAANTVGVGLGFATGVTDVALLSNIISGFATGVSHADSQTIGFDDYNDYYNNDTNATNWTLGSNSITSNPSFSSVSQVTGTTATTTGFSFIDSGKDFTALGVVAGRDYIRIVSGTGVTAGMYGISTVGTTTLTLDLAPGSSAVADKSYEITIGKNYRPGTNMRGVGYPGPFIPSYTTSYTDIGAVQRQEDYPAIADVRTGDSYSGGELTGTLDLPTEANVKISVTFDGATKTGTYDGSDRWTALSEATVLTGIAYKSNSTTNNKTGTLSVGASVWDEAISSHTTAGTFGALIQKLLTVAKFLGLK